MADNPKPALLDARFGSDPDALAWARGQVVKLRDKYREFERQAEEQGKHDLSGIWRQMANMLDMELIGGKTCVIAAFDERRPSLPGPVGVLIRSRDQKENPDQTQEASS